MTPGINAVEKSKVNYTLHEYRHDPSHNAYGLEAAEKLSIAKERVFKTLVIKLDTKELVIALIPAASMLSMKLIAKAAGGKKAAMAEKKEVERSTGYVLGGVSPLGQKKQLRTFIDSSANTFSSIFVSAGRRGLEIEISPSDLSNLVHSNFHSLCQ